MATAVATGPYSVVRFENPRTHSEAWRVTGGGRAHRVRKNFPTQAEALSHCAKLNGEAANVQAAASVALVATRLPQADVEAAERGVAEIAGRWGLSEVIAAGIRALGQAPTDEPVSDLLEAFGRALDVETNPRHRQGLKYRVGRFARENPTLTTAQLTPERLRVWLDSIPGAQQSRKNFRNAVSRFCLWLLDTGRIKSNPASAVTIRAARKGAADDSDMEMPAILTGQQMAALFKAASEYRRPMLGYFVFSTLCGLRPDSEAPRLTWSQVDLEANVVTTMGRKRGSTVRHVPLDPQAVAWIRRAKRLSDEMRPVSGKGGGIAATERLKQRAAWYSRYSFRAILSAANRALKAAGAAPIEWDNDIQRHTYASIWAPSVAIDELARRMGNSPEVIMRHYRHPLKPAQVQALREVMPQP